MSVIREERALGLLVIDINIYGGENWRHVTQSESCLSRFPF